MYLYEKNTLKNYILLLLFFLIISCNTTSKKDNTTVQSTAEIIANTYGLSNWDQVNEIKFTFNVQRDTSHYKRSWKWFPKKDSVVSISYNPNKEIGYSRTTLDSTYLKTDAAFINDSYWLLTPFKLVWDNNTTISNPEMAIAPISKDSLQKITLVYGSQGGYTPGDAYDFYLTPDHIIKEWSYRNKNSSTPSLSTTWEKNETINNLVISTMHKNQDGSLKIYFTDLTVN